MEVQVILSYTWCKLTEHVLLNLTIHDYKKNNKFIIILSPCSVIWKSFSTRYMKADTGQEYYECDWYGDWNSDDFEIENGRAERNHGVIILGGMEFIERM